MATGIIEIVKRAAVDAMRSQQMTDLRFGTVVSTSPLKVSISSELTLPERSLIVPESLTDYTVNVSVNWNTSTDDNHQHKIQGNRTITIHNALKVGDKVALVRKQGGQSYYILDRLKD